MIPINKRNYLKKIGYEFIVVGENKKYTIDVYKNEVFFKSGTIKYKCYHNALIKTEAMFYEILKIKL